MKYPCSTWELDLKLAGLSVVLGATAPTEIYTLSLHDALPISCARLFNVIGGNIMSDQIDLNYRPNTY